MLFILSGNINYLVNDDVDGDDADDDDEDDDDDNDNNVGDDDYDDVNDVQAARESGRVGGGVDWNPALCRTPC